MVVDKKKDIATRFKQSQDTLAFQPAARINLVRRDKWDMYSTSMCFEDESTHWQPEGQQIQSCSNFMTGRMIVSLTRRRMRWVNRQGSFLVTIREGHDAHEDTPGPNDDCSKQVVGA